MKGYLIVLLLCGTLWTVESSKILFIAPMPAHSHFTLVFRLAKELVDRGHQVTVINPYPQKPSIKNYTDVSVEELTVYVEELKKNLLKLEKGGMIQTMTEMFNMGGEIADRTLKNENVQKLLHSGENFDVVVMEYFINDALLGIGHHFKAPVILISPIATNGFANFIMANPAPSSYVPTLSGAFTKHMNFWQRLQNFLVRTVLDLVRETIHLPKQRKIFKKYIDTDLELDDVLYNVSLIFANSHVSISDPLPLVPSIIEIGGYHISPPKKLPDDLQSFLDNAKDGVILFSMGSNLKSKDLSEDVRNILLKALSKVKQQVLWKFETDLADTPPNVKIMKWLPQQDILAHPNVRAFISHGGLLSTIETVYHGVPIVGIPVFGDQKNNIAAAMNNGFAVSMPLAEITEEKLSWALNEVLNNPTYRENIQIRSKLMKDRPLKPIDSAVYWVEHVIRHKGAPHLRSAGLDLKWYQREMIDLFGFLTLVSLTMSLVLYIILKKIVKCICKKKVARLSKTKKNK
ncbi:hypothetical protein MTP99_017076 [Tenebrio molitor]|jgi:UDP:flavonoid glycosyltransferase YjiC (YdhE family)|uniref:UDP-glycosyltransferase UGT5-like n=1 Tax=Tenebrio molitor TaxID=7067 RepID=UPI001C3A5C56|nr:hypothetical protein MTP99_017076 [Tenebrio molitor]CAH1375667.1 unnamed protein product [Tenebrio molitor]